MFHFGHMYIELWTGNNKPFRTLEAGPSGAFGSGYLVVKHYDELPLTQTKEFLQFGTGTVGELTRAGQRLSLEQDCFGANNSKAVPYGVDVDNSNSYVTALLNAYGCTVNTYHEVVARLQDSARLTAAGAETGAEIAKYMEPLGKPYPNTPKCALRNPE